MEKDRIATLLDKYRRGNITGEEKAFLENWYQQYRESGKSDYGTRQLLEDSRAVKAALMERVFPPKKRRLSLYFGVPAAIVILAGILIVYLNSLKPDETYGAGTAGIEAIAPGGNKATLTLMSGSSLMSEGRVRNGSPETTGSSETSGSPAASGTTIQLSGKKDGIHSDGNEFKYSDGTSLGSQLPDGFHAQYAVLTTPRGGQYQVRLPDGSRVWLNAGSTLTYPVSFEGLNERRVALAGEAYFEVAHNGRKPFLVSTQNQTMEVLGTRFNINSYSAEATAKTTLLEGSLKVYAGSEAIAGGKATRGMGKAENRSNSGKENNGRLLVPGQQAILEGERITVRQVETDEAVAWKEGYFQFNNKNLETALAELARWYDVEVSFHNDKMREQKLAGTISRYARISQVLEKMELTGIIHFQIKGRTIIVE